ncbi:MAG: radical SAM/SPASM domain-containing protein [Candidatus Omnitrophota bacterium]|nr:radical SAM/SPASM domain-containing protein [Candidatus Omnitrophota bacterium]
MKVTLLNQKFSIPEIWKFRAQALGILLDRKKVGNYMRIKREYAQKRLCLQARPPILMVEDSSCCDMFCLMCPVVMEGVVREKGNMELSGFKKLMREIGETTAAICFWNFGEPLLNQDIFPIIAEAKKYGIFTAISTNLLSLKSRERQLELLESGLDYLIVSFDGASAATYEKFRGRGNFLPVLNNLKSILALKQEKRRRSPFINLQFVVMKGNEHEVGLIRQMAGELGVDKLSLKKFTYIGENARDYLPQNQEYVLGKHKDVTQMDKCSRLWESAVISWDGELIPCCGDLRFQYRFGNVFRDGGFAKLWNSLSYQDLRKRVLEDINKVEICKACPSTNFTTDMFIQ